MPRKFSRNTKSWTMFEKLFLELPREKYPYTIPGLTRGQAINLAMQLNGCQAYWIQQTGAPDGIVRYSAKAKRQGEDDWIVEVSDSPKRLGRKSPEWLEKIIAEHTTAPAHQPVVLPEPQQTSDIDAMFEAYARGERIINPPQPKSGVDEVAE
jgi:hypothetical protein